MAKKRRTVLVVDDNIEMARVLAEELTEAGFDVVPCDSGSAAIQILRTQQIDAVVTDLRMPEIDGLDILGTSLELAPERPVIVMTAYSAVDTAIESIRKGAYHYLTKPVKADELVLFLRRAFDEQTVRREASSLKATLRERYSASVVIGQSPPMAALRDFIERAAHAPAPVLILGETGTGKGLVARALHAEGERAAAAFVPVNCAAIPETLLESELFGHLRGAFTGATTDRMGLFVQADGGTLFLDEIGDLSLALQAKLLHALERGVIRPVGSERERSVDVRILAATHRDLREAVRRGAFREDLLYRLDVVSVTVPALRHRREDIPELVTHFLQLARARYPKAKVQRVSPEALGLMLRYDWPGNVRELAHTMERALVLGREEEMAVADLPDTLRAPAPRDLPDFGDTVIPIRQLQRQYAAWALARLGGHRGRTTERLGIDAKTLAKWLSELEEGNAKDDP